MIRLAVLLVGADALGRRWRVLAGLGLVWLALGLAIMADAADGVSFLATRAFAGLLVAEGLIAIAVAAAAGRRLARVQRVKALGLIVLGFLILDWPWYNEIANSLLFGLAFLIDGLIRIATAWIVRFRRWQLIVLAGAVELGLAALALTSWPVSYQHTVPFCVGFALALSGWSALRTALVLRKVRVAAHLTTLPLLGSGRWHGPRAGEPAQAAIEAASPLTVHVWTPLGSAEGARGAPVVNRYIAAIDQRGRISTGHAALAAEPGVYISHYPASEVEFAPEAFASGLRASADNDVPGRFLPTYLEEVAGWREADEHVRFHRFDAGRLASHWTAYRADTTYNLTNRNCSVSVALALEAALDGVLASGCCRLRFVKLLADPNLWLAALIRTKAESMTWTPGLVLDYARALKAVVERADVSWYARLRQAIKRWRIARGRVREEAGIA